MENSNQIAIPVILRGDNYLLWCRTTKTALCSRGLWKYVMGNVSTDSITVMTNGEVEETPNITSFGDAKWIQGDQIVLAFLQYFLKPEILAAYSYIEQGVVGYSQTYFWECY